MHLNMINCLFHFLKLTLLLLIKAKFIIDIVFASFAFKEVVNPGDYEIKVKHNLLSLTILHLI